MTHEVRITPSILNADHASIHAEIERIAAASDFIHLDIMDNIFVPNETWNFDAASEIIARSSAPIDAHLMVADVDSIAIDYARAGARSVTVHVEAVHSLAETLKGIRNAGARAAIALKPDTSIDHYSPILDLVDMVLIMTVEPGFGGQSFMKNMLPKIEKTRTFIGERPIWLQVDGGITLETIESAAHAGADTFVAGSAVFKAEDPAEMISRLRAAATQAMQ
jgi:ribulose-phosphate 3-epimerase